MTRLDKKLINFFITSGLILLAIFGLANSVSAEAEVIRDFGIRMTVQTDGVVQITEVIQYDFGTNQKHGIFRNIPLTTKDGPRLGVSVLGINNETGQKYKYTTSIANDVLQIKIGDADVLVSGLKTYIISYQVRDVIRGFEDHNELYWNVTGNEWPVAIEKVFVSILLPGQSISGLRMDCFTGYQGSTEKNCTFGQNVEYANYSTSQTLDFGEGLTIVLGIPQGYIISGVAQYVDGPAKNTDGDNAFLLIFFVIAIPAVFVFLVIKAFASKARRSKPKPRIPKELKGQPIVVEYNPPDALPPIEIGTILDRVVDPTDISSVILDLAIRGYLKIRYTVEKIKFWPDKEDFELIKLKDGTDLVHPADKIIFELLFGKENAVNQSIRLSDLGKSGVLFQKTVKKIEEEVTQHLTDQGYFDKAATEKIKKLSKYSVLITGLTILFSLMLDVLDRLIPSNILIPVVIAFVVVVIVVARRFGHKLSPQGMLVLAKVLGFREFLQLTEKDKLDLLNAPELQPETFEKFLPYAMVLGVEDKWAKKFEGIYNTFPVWYEDPTMPVFTSFVLMQNLASFDRSFNQVFKITTPRSSSGFSGGSSGGGSGGGGGGSW